MVLKPLYCGTTCLISFALFTKPRTGRTKKLMFCTLLLMFQILNRIGFMPITCKYCLATSQQNDKLQFLRPCWKAGLSDWDCFMYSYSFRNDCTVCITILTGSTSSLTTLFSLDKVTMACRVGLFNWGHTICFVWVWL